MPIKCVKCPENEERKKKLKIFCTLLFLQIVFGCKTAHTIRFFHKTHPTGPVTGKIFTKNTDMDKRNKLKKRLTKKLIKKSRTAKYSKI